MKILAALTILAAGMSCLLVNTTIQIFANLSDPDVLRGFDMDRIIVGNIEHMWVASAFWERFPAFLRSFDVYIEMRSLMMVGALVSAAIYVLRVKRKTPWTIVAWFCFLSGLAPYSIGRLYLWNNTVAAESGSWLAFALMGQLYASLACAVCATLEFFPPQSPNSISEIDALAPPAAIFESPS